MSKVVERWFNMIRINSVNGHEVDLADYIAKELTDIGLEPHYSYFPEDIEEKVRPSIWTVLDSGKPGKTLMLIGHIDTVRVARGWNTDPFTPTEDADEKGKIYGLGAMDMKGGLAGILETLEYYSQNKGRITGKLIACFVADEENLSRGTFQLAEEGITADYAIMTECRYDNAAIGFRGRYAFDVTVRGEAAHSSKYPEAGENALISGSRLAEAIEALPTLSHPRLKHGTWCVRRIQGGVVDALIVPDTCELYVERFVVPGEDQELCIEQMMKAAENLGLKDKVDICLRPRKLPYMESFALEPDDYLVVTLQKKFEEVTGGKLPIAYDASVCDSNILAGILGIPTVTFGPSGGGMHSANEYGHVWQVENCAEIYKRTAAEILK